MMMLMGMIQMITQVHLLMVYKMEIILMHGHRSMWRVGQKGRGGVTQVRSDKNKGEIGFTPT